MTATTHYQQGHLLAIDTSTAALTVAVLNNGQLLGELSSHAERNHSIGLLPQIRKLLGDLGLKPKDLQAVAVGQGPGSYTGVRIGVSVAKTFAWSLGLDLIGVSSLEAMALGCSAKVAGIAETSGSTAVRWFVPLMDARRSQAFTAVYESRVADAETSWRSVLPDGIRVMAPWTEQLLARAAEATQEAPQEIIFLGETEGFTAQIEQFAGQWSGRVQALPYSLEAQYVGLLAYPKLAAGERAEVHTFVPNYAQLPEAEVNYQAKLKQQRGEL